MWCSDADQYSWPLYYGSKLVQVSDGKNWGTISNGHHAFDLPAGDYRIEVERPGEGGTYWFTSFLKPAVQEFSLNLGQKVEPGKIGGVDVVGAGNLETSASKDVYTFTVPEGGQSVVFDADRYTWPLYYGSKLVQVSDGKNWGTINGHHAFDLPAGDYRNRGRASRRRAGPTRLRRRHDPPRRPSRTTWARKVSRARSVAWRSRGPATSRRQQRKTSTPSRCPRVVRVWCSM